MGQSALALASDAFEETLYYHDPARPGFFSLLAANDSGQLRQQSFKLQELAPQVAAYRARGCDAYIAQNEFFRPNRRAVNVWRLTSHFVDLDTYKIPNLVGRPMESIRDQVLMACHELGIPEPSLMVYSGRGMQAKWLLEHTVPSAAVPRWQAVQDELCARLAPLGADEKARDVSRVLRLTGTVNTRSGEVVRVVHRAQTPTQGGVLLPQGVVGYGFDLLAETLLPFSRAALEAQAAANQATFILQPLEKRETSRRTSPTHLVAIPGGRTANGSGHPLVPSQLAWDRLTDVRTLFTLRDWQHGAPAGERNIPLFLSACFLADACVVREIFPELVELAKEMAPTWTRAELQSCASSALSRAQAAAHGEKVEFDGRSFNPK